MMRIGLPLFPVFLLFLQASPLPAHEMSAEIRFSMFSGRMPPRVILIDSAEVQAVRAAASTCTARPIPCSEVPPQPSILGYTGLEMTLSPPFSGADPKLTVREGYAHAGSGFPCYVDSGRALERLALELAFRHDDLEHPGGPAPMGYLSCMIPEEVRPAAAPCSTTSLAPKPRSTEVLPKPGRRVDAAGRAREAVPKGGVGPGVKPLRLYAEPKR